MRNWPDNWSTKETDQKYMDAKDVKKVAEHKIVTYSSFKMSKIKHP